MGQTLSRRLAGSFESGLQRARQQMEKQMKDEVKKDKHGFSDPSAAIGFTRGMGKVQDPRDAMQEEFKKRAGQGNSTGDMPEVRW